MESTSKILLIDDDQALLKTYQKLFTLKGFDIISGSVGTFEKQSCFCGDHRRDYAEDGRYAAFTGN